MSRHILPLAALFSTLAIVASARAQTDPRYGWTISASSTDPFVNTASFAPATLQTVYLWYVCTTFWGMASAEFDVVSVGPTHLSTTPANGYINAGTTSSLLLAVGACPVGPVIAANLLILAASGHLCLGPSPNGYEVVHDCFSQFDLYPIDWIGLDLGDGACAKGELCGGIVAIESASLGRLKSLYR